MIDITWKTLYKKDERISRVLLSCKEEVHKTCCNQDYFLSHTAKYFSPRNEPFIYLDLVHLDTKPELAVVLKRITTVLGTIFLYLSVTLGHKMPSRSYFYHPLSVPSCFPSGVFVLFSSIKYSPTLLTSESEFKIVLLFN